MEYFLEQLKLNIKLLPGESMRHIVELTREELANQGKSIPQKKIDKITWYRYNEPLLSHNVMHKNFV
jgi:hypothetical protein